jgi:hypothetical protein
LKIIIHNYLFAKPETLFFASRNKKSYKVEEILEKIDSFFTKRQYHPEFDNLSFIGGGKKPKIQM